MSLATRPKLYDVTRRRRRMSLRSYLSNTDIADVISPICEELQNVLNQIIAEWSDEGSQSTDGEREAAMANFDESNGSGDEENDGLEIEDDDDDALDFTAALIAVLARGEVVFSYPWGFTFTVIRVTDNVVAKLIPNKSDMTEYATLEYLRDHAPHVLAPRPCGVVEFVRCKAMFSSYLPGMDLETAWPQMSTSDMQHISLKIDSIMVQVRAIPRPANTPLGGINGVGCKDWRRFERKSEAPLYTVQEFENFVFDTTLRCPLYAGFIHNFALGG